MKSQTRTEIQRCQDYLKQTDISQHDREMAERGLLDWFLASVIEDGHFKEDNHETTLPLQP